MQDKIQLNSDKNNIPMWRNITDKISYITCNCYIKIQTVVSAVVINIIFMLQVLKSIIPTRSLMLLLHLMPRLMSMVQSISSTIQQRLQTCSQ